MFDGTFTSDNGLYSVSVTDDGIVLGGPSGTITLDDGGVTLDGLALLIDGQFVTINGAAITSVQGGLLRLNGNCSSVQTTGGPSGTVFAC